MKNKASLRTCIGCRKIQNPASMLRIATRFDHRSGKRVAFFDYAHLAAGRGAWVHNEAKCLASALRQGVLRRSFRFEVETSELELT